MGERRRTVKHRGSFITCGETMCALSGQYFSQTSADLFLMTVLSVPRSVSHPLRCIAVTILH